MDNSLVIGVSNIVYPLFSHPADPVDRSISRNSNINVDKRAADSRWIQLPF